jgi:hypothetical protein
LAVVVSAGVPVLVAVLVVAAFPVSAGVATELDSPLRSVASAFVGVAGDVHEAAARTSSVKEVVDRNCLVIGPGGFYFIDADMWALGPDL